MYWIHLPTIILSSSIVPHSLPTMSSSIAIPNAHLRAASQAMASSSASSLSSSPGSSPAGSPSQRTTIQARRPSLLSMSLIHCREGGFANLDLGSSLSKQESTVINIGDPDGPPRLVCPLLRCPGATLTMSRSPISPPAKASPGTQVSTIYCSMTDNPS